MYTDKLWKKMLLAARVLAVTLLALLLATACAPKNEIQSADGQALIEQGNAYMTCLKASDLECAYELMCPSAQHLLDDAQRMAGGVVNLASAVKTYAPKISAWTFDQANFSTRDGTTIGSLEGEVVYMDGERGKVKLEFEKDGETWKARSSGMEP